MKLDLLPWITTTFLAILFAWMCDEYFTLRSEYDRYRARVAQQAEDMRAAATATEARQRDTIATLKEHYEKRIVEVNAIALANYRRMRDDAATRERITLSLAPGSVAVDAGTAAQCVAAASATGEFDEGVITGCAEDALKLTAWQDWAKRNQILVEP